MCGFISERFVLLRWPKCSVGAAVLDGAAGGGGCGGGGCGGGGFHGYGHWQGIRPRRFQAVKDRALVADDLPTLCCGAYRRNWMRRRRRKKYCAKCSMDCVIRWARTAKCCGRRADVAKTLRTENFSEESLADVIARHDEVHDRMRKSLVDALAKLHTTLDAGQREKLANLIANGPFFGRF